MSDEPIENDSKDEEFSVSDFDNFAEDLTKPIDDIVKEKI